MKRLSNKVALVTGGSRGIGAAIVERLAHEGANVVLTYTRNADQGNKVVAKAMAKGIKAKAIQADNGNEAAVIKAVEDTVAEFGKVDILVNNAGVLAFAPIDEFKLDDFDRTISVNVRGTFIATQAAVKYMKEGGRIINIGSVNAERMPSIGGAVYAMSKSALVGLTKGLARDLGHRGITINNIQPGPVDTDMNPADGDFAKTLLPLMALPRYGTGAEIAGMVIYLASAEASYITGASLTIDGGFAA